MNKKKIIFRIKKKEVMKALNDCNPKNKNFFFLIKNRFNWMNNYINQRDVGLEVGAGAGFSKLFIKSKKNYISDITNFDHLDFKKLDAQKLNIKKKFNYIIATNMIHHLNYPLKFFLNAYKILKKKGKILIFEPNCSLLLKLTLFLTKKEDFDFKKNIWKIKSNMISGKNIWNGNNAIPNLLFDNRKKFLKNLGKFFNIQYHEYCECITFINSGGVYIKAFKIPLNSFFLKIFYIIDLVLIYFFPKIFALGQKIVLEKKG